ncbi:unnamed protein product [Arctogadus glacialis]
MIQGSGAMPGPCPAGSAPAGRLPVGRALRRTCQSDGLVRVDKGFLPWLQALCPAIRYKKKQLFDSPFTGSGLLFQKSDVLSTLLLAVA